VELVLIKCKLKTERIIPAFLALQQELQRFSMPSLGMQLILCFPFPSPPSGLDVSREEITTQLSSVGFTDEMLEMVITSLSGGWKMKLALARAMLMKADILLLDEPTNHLDVTNVAWLENYLCGLKTVTSIIVSHDSGFLDRVCS